MMSDLRRSYAFSFGIPLCGVLLGVVAVTGCAGSQEATPQNAANAGASNVSAPPPVDRSRCKSAGKQVVEADTNLDKKPDVWKYYVSNTQGAQVITCKQVDLNHDGKVDITYYYDDTGAQSSLEEFDLDFDGRNDLTVYYANGKKVREELDTNYDGRSDLWKFYEAENLVRLERDADYNGRADQWEYYEGGKLDRIGYDTSGSGRVDKWDRAPEGADEGGPVATAAPTPATAPPAPAPAPAPAPSPAPAPAAPKK
jgi:hypothetical protein